jgi:hypothetical protein
MAIEYYDIICNNDFHYYFLSKVNELMSKNSINKYLDEICKITNKENEEMLKYNSEKLKEEIFPSNKIEDKGNLNKDFYINKSKNINMDILKSFDDKYIDDKIQRKKLKQKNKLFTSIQKVENESNLKDKEQNKEKMNEKLIEITVNLDKIKNNIDSDLLNQHCVFEKLRDKKRESQKERSIFNLKV